MAIAVIAILMVLLMPATEAVRDRVEGGRCMNGMRQLVTGFHAYLTDHERIWPQLPQKDGVRAAGEEEKEFWLTTLKPYGVGDVKAWQCPSLMRRMGSNEEVGKKAHYAPVLFDEKPGTAFQWTNMPWLVELGNYHGRGALGAFSDGSVRPLGGSMVKKP